MNASNFAFSLASGILLGKFTSTIYPWLMEDKQKINKSIRYINRPIDDVLKYSVERYDFIHLSNVLDWLNVAEAEDLLNIAADKVNPGGFVLSTVQKNHRIRPILIASSP